MTVHPLLLALDLTLPVLALGAMFWMMLWYRRRLRMAEAELHAAGSLLGRLIRPLQQLPPHGEGPAGQVADLVLLARRVSAGGEAYADLVSDARRLTDASKAP